MAVAQAPITVSEFVAAAKSQIEQQVAAVAVTGEVANFACAASGHWYFSLRDDQTQVDCVMLARQNRLAEVKPSNGDKVVVSGSASLYAPRARFQLTVRFLFVEGEGYLHQLFVQRKAQWRERGWFGKVASPPLFPRTVGIVCSTAGAALHDVLHTLKNRYPLLTVIIYPAPAQGDDAAEKIAMMIRHAANRRECDVLIICRGGGGIKDLWAYNEEPVVAGVYECPIPVISGIGHEIDETLTDYAADKHCPTPTAAAVAAVPQAAALQDHLDRTQTLLTRCLQESIDTAEQRIDRAIYWLSTPSRLLETRQAQWRQRQDALRYAMGRQLDRWQNQLAVAVARLSSLDLRALQTHVEATDSRLKRAVQALLAAQYGALANAKKSLLLLSPEKVLRRGYSVVSNRQGEVVSSVNAVHPQETLNVRFHDGAIAVDVKRTVTDKNAR